jgi:hypothetical protein
MSSTNRTKEEKKLSADYYATSLQAIRDFITAARTDIYAYPECPEMVGIISPAIGTGLDEVDSKISKVLDPCAGGSEQGVMPIPMSYPTVLAEFGFKYIDTLDIRQDSLAAVKGDYLKTDCKDKYNLIITNPPFNLALEIIEKALDDVRPNGHVIMLQRVNFLGSQKRKGFFEKNMPKAVYVHSNRIKFHHPDGGAGTDSVEYAHYVWDKYSCGRKTAYLRVI